MILRYETIQDAMKTRKGQALYKVLSKGFDRGVELSNRYVKDAINGPLASYLGSQAHIERLVWMIMNERNY